jgi:carbon starvation protein
MVTGAAAWHIHYASWEASSGLASKLQAVVIGSANMMSTLGIPTSLGAVIMGVFIASFAGTTLDTSTRLQRYVMAELGAGLGRKISIRWGAFWAVLSAGILAFSAGLSGAGALQLWPLFGVLNQLLAAIGLGLLVLFIARLKPSYTWVAGGPILYYDDRNNLRVFT